MALPARLGRLERVRRLGTGGFATVWLYHDPELDSDVAVKALADNWAARGDVRERFLNEARLLRRADSDHVVRVHDVGESDGTPYFVMTYADGGTVADLVGSPRAASEVVDLVEQAADGLSRLHAIGVVHRDVKPQNLLLTERDGRRRLMVADLGVAKALAQGSGITQVVGTEAYMAPEQADPVAGVDVRADVHALGAVARALLTGSPDRSTPVPGPMGDVVDRATAAERDQRWRDVRTFADALTRATGHQDARTTVLTDAPADDATTEPARPRRWLVAAIATLAVLAVTLGVAGTARVLVDDTGPSDGPTNDAQPPIVAPRMELDGAWSARPASSSHTDYEQEDGTRLSLDRKVVAQPPEVTARLGALRSSTLAGYEELRLTALPASVRGQWQSGWQVQFAWTDRDGDRLEGWTWYLGNDAQTVGYVGVRTAPGDVGRYRDVLESARKQVLDTAGAVTTTVAPADAVDVPAIPALADLPGETWAGTGPLRGLTCAAPDDVTRVAVAPAPRRWGFDAGTTAPCTASAGSRRLIELAVADDPDETGQRRFARGDGDRRVDVVEVTAGGWRVTYTAPQGDLDTRTVEAMQESFVGTPTR